MRLHAAAKFFDKTKVYDGYTGSYLFSGQLDLYDGSVTDTSKFGRRTLSAMPSVISIPSRRVVTIEGYRYLVGENLPDSFGGSEIRSHLIIHPASDSTSIKTNAQALITGGTSAYAGLSWLKELKEESVSSNLFNRYYIYFSTYETLTRGNLVVIGSNYYRILGIIQSSAGFQIADCVELPSAIQTITYTPAGAYSTTSDSFAAGTPANYSAIVERWQDNFEYRSEAYVDPKPGDKVVVIPKASKASCSTDDRVTVSSVVYKIMEIADDGNSSWELLVRRV